VNRDSLLDYRFAWRWLLPLVRNERLYLVGFDKKEENFWQKVLKNVTITQDNREATFILVQGAIPPENFNGMQYLSGCAVVADGKVARKWIEWARNLFPAVKIYALIPPENPRIVVPLNNSNEIREGLALHRPGRRLARIVVFLLKMLVDIGISAPLKRRVLLIAHKNRRMPIGAVAAGLSTNISGCEYALYFGTPDDNRKTVALVMGKERSFVVKSGDSLRSLAALKNEAAALECLAESGLSARVPQLLDYREKDGHAVLRQGYGIRKRTAAWRIERAVEEFLCNLSYIDRQERTLKEVLKQEVAIGGIDKYRACSSVHRLLGYLDRLADEGKVLYGHRGHGDFAPWNRVWTRSGLLVFDWEASQPWDLALVDAFYYRIAPVLHIRGKKKRLFHIHRDALSMWERVAVRADLPVRDGEVYWVLWLLRQLGLSSHRLYRDLLEEVAMSWKPLNG